MPIKAVGFDIDNTLVKQKPPLHWKIHFPALRAVLRNCQIDECALKINHAATILIKYNPRVNYREHEVSSDAIFAEILDAWNRGHEKLHTAKAAFFDFFQADV